MRQRREMAEKEVREEEDKVPRGSSSKVEETVAEPGDTDFATGAKVPFKETGGKVRRVRFADGEGTIFGG